MSMATVKASGVAGSYPTAYVSCPVSVQMSFLRQTIEHLRQKEFNVIYWDRNKGYETPKDVDLFVIVLEGAQFNGHMTDAQRKELDAIKPGCVGLAYQPGHTDHPVIYAAEVITNPHGSVKGRAGTAGTPLGKATENFKSKNTETRIMDLDGSLRLSTSTLHKLSDDFFVFDGKASSYYAASDGGSNFGVPTPDEPKLKGSDTEIPNQIDRRYLFRKKR